MEAIIHPASPRAALWREVLGSERAPVESPAPSWALIPGAPNQLCYQLAVDALDQGQRQALVRHFSRHFGIPAEEAEEELESEGVVIFAQDVYVAREAGAQE